MKAEKLTLYLNKEELKTFLYIKNKNKLSFSTIIDILVSSDIYKGDLWKEKYIFSTRDRNRTSVKPRMLDIYSTNQKTKIINNLVHIYINRDFGIYADETMKALGIKEEKKGEMKNKVITDYLNTIQRELENRIDMYYLYNETTRNQIKFIKENKDYIEKLQKGK